MATDIDVSNIDDNDPEAPRQLREAYKRANARASAADSMEKELKILRAGVDTSTRLGKAFLATFEGNVDDAEAIRADATEFSPSILAAVAAIDTSNQSGTTPDPATQGTPTPEDFGAAARNALADGALASGAAKPDVLTESVNVARDIIEKGGTVEDGMASLIAARSRGLHEGTLAALSPDGARR